MTTQPEALRLADALEEFWGYYDGPEEPNELNAAAELRRLHEVNQELLEALKYHQEQTRPIQRTIDAIAKAGGSNAT